MKVLYLGPENKDMLDFLASFGDEVIRTEEPLDNNILEGINFIVSYRYKHIIKPQVIDQFKNRIINLHISYLPWNKGADPNLWSFLEDTPKGVSIHYVDYGLDTGDIIAQKEVPYTDSDTLRTAYERLSNSIEELFKKIWPKVRNGELQGKAQLQNGTYHKMADKKKYEFLLSKCWDTPVVDLIGKAKEDKNEKLY